MTVHFISDLHLDPSRPETTHAFLAFLAGPARDATDLWILGDLFEVWIGDDDLRDPFNAQIADALAALRAAGVRTHLIVGNRDFLLGRRFAARSGVRIVAEPVHIELGSHRVVLLHGDAQCTDDVPYQKFRRRVRSPLWRAFFLLLPLATRRRIATKLRAHSDMAKQGKSTDIMDVNAQAIQQAFRDGDAIVMIHGHTHRPALHELVVDGKTRRRYVLPDWHGVASGLTWDGDGFVPFGSSR